MPRAMELTILLSVVTAVFYWAGYRGPHHSFQYKSKVGFFFALALTILAAYFTWREARTLSELSELVDPLPSITDVITYVPTSTEVSALSQLLSKVPGEGSLGSDREAHRNLTEQTQNRRTEYWIVSTRLRADSVVAFYRKTAPLRGWRIATDSPPWLTLKRDSERLILFVSDDFPRPGSSVLYGFSASSPHKAHAHGTVAYTIGHDTHIASVR